MLDFLMIPRGGKGLFFFCSSLRTPHDHPIYGNEIKLRPTYLFLIYLSIFRGGGKCLLFCRRVRSRLLHRIYRTFKLQIFFMRYVLLQLTS